MKKITTIAFAVSMSSTIFVGSVSAAPSFCTYGKGLSFYNQGWDLETDRLQSRWDRFGDCLNHDAFLSELAIPSTITQGRKNRICRTWGRHEAHVNFVENVNEVCVDSIDWTSKVSECGGFVDSRTKTTVRSYTFDYCDAEVLNWQFDRDRGVLTIDNNRVLLNCCGERSIDAHKRNDEYFVIEKDAPQSEGGRCRCMCVYDFSLQITNVSDGTAQITIIRETTDSDEQIELIYHGTIDLSQNSGTIFVDESDVGSWCD